MVLINPNELNVGQQLFLVLFSILFGVLLQSLPGGLFPLASMFWGRKTRYRKRKYRTNLFIRSFLSILIFNLLPAVYLWKILQVLQIVSFPSDVYAQGKYILTVFWCSLGVFGFYRIY